MFVLLLILVLEDLSGVTVGRPTDESIGICPCSFWSQLITGLEITLNFELQWEIPTLSAPAPHIQH